MVCNAVLSALARFSLRLVLILVVGLIMCPAARAGAVPPGVSIYVSPFGNDANPGTQIAPLRTLTHAQQVVRSLNRNMTANVSVYLEDGTYRLTQPLQFGPLDSGSNGYDVIWTGAPGSTAIISGAKRISGWKLSDASKDIWAATIPSSLRTRQIYVNGMRASLTLGRAPVKLKTVRNGYVASSAIMSHWRNPKQIEFAYNGQLGQMTEPICPVDTIHGDQITMAEPCWANSTRRWHGGELVVYGGLGAPTYIENADELLNQPGQFYLDGLTHVLYYIPRPGEDMATADVEAPVLQTVVEGAGTAATPVHNLTFSNLQFSYATWMQPSTPTGFSEVQSGFTVTGPHGYATEGLCHLVRHGTCPFGAWTKEPGNVQFTYDRNISFLNDRFVHLGATGLNLDNGSQHSSVMGSVFTDISGNGLEIGDVNEPEARGSTLTTNVTVADNHFYGIGVEYHGAAAILAGYVSHTAISHNQIDHVPYTGISIGWGGWPDKLGRSPVPNNTRDDVISDNLIYDYMLTLDDGGGVYTQGITGTSMGNGEKVTGNVIHDQLGWSFALHSDNGASFITYAKNVLYNDTYDWGTSHLDFSGGHGGLDPLLLEHNFWQQGTLSSPSYQATTSANKIITGPEQAPSSVLQNAGIEPAFQSILAWQAPGESVPNPPQRVTVLYAFRGSVYVAWRPSYGAVNDPVTSYTVIACRVRSAGQSACTQPAVPTLTITAATYDQLGYAVVHGLADGKGYDFMVSAQSSGGSSTPSIPSTIVQPATQSPRRPSRPKDVVAQAGHDCISLHWYPSDNVRTRPIAYVVTSSAGQVYTFTGLEQLVLADQGGRTLHVIGGLMSGHRYRFSVAAVTPTGAGPAVMSHWVKAG